MSRMATLRVAFARVGSGEPPTARPCQVIKPTTTSAAKIERDFVHRRSRIIGSSSVSIACAGGSAVVVSTLRAYHKEKSRC